MGEKTRRRKGTESPPGRKNHRSLLQRCPRSHRSQMAPSAATLRDVGISLPGGPFRSPLPPAQPQGGWEGRASWKLLLPRRSWAQGWGERQAKSKWAARARVRMKSAAASGRRRAGRAPWRLPEQSHGSNEINDGGDGFFSFCYWSGYHRNLTALKELESGAGRGEQRCGFGVGDTVNKEGGEKNKREIKFKKSWKRRHSKLYRYTIHR